MSVTHDEVTRAARVLVDVEPPADLEARIAVRLDAVTTLPKERSWSRYFLAATVAAGLVVALVSSQFRGSEVPEFRSAEVPEFRSAEVPRIPNSPVPQRPVSAPIRLPAYRTASESEVEWMSRRVPALDPIEEITIDEVAFDLIQPPPVLITPLTMTPLVTSPVFGDPDTIRQ